MQIEEQIYRRSDLPRLIEQQVLDFGRIVWSDGSVTEDSFRDRMHDVPEDTTHFVRAAGSLLVRHVHQVIPIEVDGRRPGPQAVGRECLRSAESAPPTARRLPRRRLGDLLAAVAI